MAAAPNFIVIPLQHKLNSEHTEHLGLFNTSL